MRLPLPFRSPMPLAGLALVAALAFAAPAASQNAAEPAQPDGPIALETDPARDARIEDRIDAILGELSGYDGVQVDVTAGVVALTGETPDAAARARLVRIVSRVDGVAAVADGVTESTDVAERLWPSIDRFVLRAAQTLAYLPLLTVAGLAFLLVFTVGLLISAPAPLWNRIAPNSFIGGIYRQIVRIVFGLVGLVLALDILGATALLGSILGAAGIIGLAIGFAVRDTVENFLASVMLSIRQPFQPFDLVEIEGDVGKVVRLTSRATILLSLDGNTIRVPNATVFKSRIVNFTHNPERRFDFALPIDPAADMAGLRDMVQRTLAGLPFVLADPVSAVWIEEETGGNVALRVSAWIDQRETDWALARGEAYRILRALIEARGAMRPPPLSRVVRTTQEAVTEARQGAERDLQAGSLADMSKAQTDDAALARIAEADRARSDSRDLLGTGRQE